MNALTGSELLQVWDAGAAQTPVERALLLAAVADPDAGVEALAATPLGRIDGMLLRLRQATFGDELTLVLECPECGTALEAGARVSELLVAGDERQETGATIETGGFEVSFRLPNAFDLAATAASDSAVAARELLSRCLREIRRGETTVPADALPDEVAERVIESMAALDPQADVELTLVCPTCTHAASAPLDITGVLWAEIDAAARHLLLEVDRLARVYGWSERDILSMSARRRRAYLELAG